MKSKILIVMILAAISGFALVAYAQVTATNIVLGNLTSSGCTGSVNPCFNQYSSGNPMPVTLTITR